MINIKSTKFPNSQPPILSNFLPLQVVERVHIGLYIGYLYGLQSPVNVVPWKWRPKVRTSQDVTCKYKDHNFIFF